MMAIITITTSYGCFKYRKGCVCIYISLYIIYPSILQSVYPSIHPPTYQPIYLEHILPT